MSDKNEKGFLSRVFKGAATGAGIAFVAAAILPVITVSAPVLLIGAAIGTVVVASKKDDKGPKNG